MLDQIVELLLQVLWLLLNVSCHDPLQSENAVLKEQSKIMNCLFVQKIEHSSYPHYPKQKETI